MWDRTGRSFHNLIYMCTVRMVRRSWYITWKGVQRKGEIEKQIGKKIKEYNTRRRNSRFLIILFWLGRWRFLYLIRIIILPNHPRSLPLSKFRLILFPTLYKFIVWAYWAWVQSCFGVQAKTGPYSSNLIILYMCLQIENCMI